jgi:hypothetical protein
VLAAARDCGKGRAAFFAGLPFTLDNCGLLHRAILWATQKEDCLTRWHSTNARTECAWYPDVQRLVVINNVGTPQTTKIRDGTGKTFEIELKPYESQWFTV